MYWEGPKMIASASLTRLGCLPTLVYRQSTPSNQSESIVSIALLKKKNLLCPHNINLNIHSTVFHLYPTVKADVSQSNSSTNSTSCLRFLNTCLDCTSQITEKKWSYSLTFSFSELRRGTGKAHTLLEDRRMEFRKMSLFYFFTYVSLGKYET